MIADGIALVSALVALLLARSSGLGTAILLLGAVVLLAIDFVLVFKAIRNYVFIDDKHIVIIYGFKTHRLNSSDILIVRHMENPTKPGKPPIERALSVLRLWLLRGDVELFSHAASFDRFELTTRFDTVVASVKNKDGFMAEIAVRCPDARIVL